MEAAAGEEEEKEEEEEEEDIAGGGRVCGHRVVWVYDASSYSIRS